MSDDKILPANARVELGLDGQGHIPLILHMLTEGKPWAEIGKAIGWCPITARRHFERWVDGFTRARAYLRDREAEGKK